MSKLPVGRVEFSIDGRKYEMSGPNLQVDIGITEEEVQSLRQALREWENLALNGNAEWRLSGWTRDRLRSLLAKLETSTCRR